MNNKLAEYRLVIVTINGLSFMCHAPIGKDGRPHVELNWALRKLGLPTQRNIALRLGR